MKVTRNQAECVVRSTWSSRRGPGEIIGCPPRILNTLEKKGLAYDASPLKLGDYWLTRAGWEVAHEHALQVLGEELYPGIPDYLTDHPA